MKLGIGGDHAGYVEKLNIIKHLEEKGHEVVDYGCHSEDSCDYPDYVHPMASAVESGEIDLGFAVCGSGNGVNITVNKHQGVRGALCWLPEIASLARQHNNANICSLPCRFLETQELLTIVDTFVESTFEGGRHQLRVDKIALK